MSKVRYRFSKQRQTILDVVRDLKGHTDAETIHKAVGKVNQTISLSTVYRNLNQLVEMGQLAAVKEKGMMLYEANLEDHDHFYCYHCKTWYDVDILTDGVIASFARGRSFRIDTINLELGGTCEKCLKA